MNINFNLLPWRTAAILKRVYYFGVQLLISISLAILIWWYWHQSLRQQINFGAKNTLGLKQQLSIVTNQLQGEEKLKQRYSFCAEQLKKVKQLEKKQLKINKIFTQLHLMSPTNLYFTQLAIIAGAVKIEGRAKTMLDLKRLVDELSLIDGNRIVLPKLEYQEGFYGFSLSEEGVNN